MHSPHSPAWSLHLDRVDVDTDQIIPKQFLKTIKRTGLREGLFYDWRRRKRWIAGS